MPPSLPTGPVWGKAMSPSPPWSWAMFPPHNRGGLGPGLAAPHPTFHLTPCSYPRRGQAMPPFPCRARLQLGCPSPPPQCGPTVPSTLAPVPDQDLQQEPAHGQTGHCFSWPLRKKVEHNCFKPPPTTYNFCKSMSR